MDNAFFGITKLGTRDQTTPPPGQITGKLVSRNGLIIRSHPWLSGLLLVLPGWTEAHGCLLFEGSLLIFTFTMEGSE
jgi:hypothetical protein